MYSYRLVMHGNSNIKKSLHSVPKLMPFQPQNCNVISELSPSHERRHQVISTLQRYVFLAVFV